MPELDDEHRDDQSYGDEDEDFDSDAMMYDSEEEEHQERLAREGKPSKPLNMNTVKDGKGKQFEMIEAPDAEYDANQQMKKN